MEYMQVLVDEQLHRQVKANAALLGMTIREFTERALRKALETRVLVDTREPYSIDPRYDFGPDERDPSPSEIDWAYAQPEEADND